jgi:ubiquinone/menaquinone biosynthesis C-methylase UbiE
MGFYETRVLPHLVDAALSGRQFERLRRRVTERVAGDVLEVGFGSGRNVPYYGPGVRRVLAVDPALTGRKIAAKRVAASPTPIEYVGLDGQQLPLDDASVDDVLTTWTLCTIPDAAQALGEMRRVLRPGGALHFLEHGRSPDESVVRWQDRLTPIQRRVAGGCHLNRAIDRLVTDAGFDVSELDNYYLKGPKVFGYMYEGIATKA